jgi:hypothetical protein
VRHHKIGADELAGLIVEVHRALASLRRATPAQESITKSTSRPRSWRIWLTKSAAPSQG